jgi:predicted permease
LLLAENLLLTLAGALLGVLIAVGGVRLLVSFAARYSPRANEIGLDRTTLVFALVLSVAMALLLSFMAALPREGKFSSWMSAGARRIGGTVRKQRLQRGLVIAQIAVSVILLAGAGLLTRTMIELSDVNTGLHAEEVLTLPVQLLQFGDGDFKRIAAADAKAKDDYDRMIREVRALPGVVSVGLGSTPPLRGSSVGLEVKAEGRTVAVGEATPRADLRTANPEYFRAAGVPLIKGRGFESTDGLTNGKVVILNQTLAERLFHGEDPIGKRVAWTGEVLRFTPFSPEWRTVVGVVGSTRDGGLDAEPPSAMFMPFAQELALGGVVIIRADSNAAGLAAAATRIARTIAPNVPIENVLTVSQIKDESVAPRRLNAELISLFGTLALVIATVGIAGVLAFSVSARTNEIGIRMSLGADRGRVQRMILGEGGILVVAGLALGVSVAYFAAGVLKGLLFGVAPHDPVTFVGVVLMMAVIGIVACWIPALRAARIDPAVAMRAT